MLRCCLLVLFLLLPAGAQSLPPVVLVNGYQFPPCGDLTSDQTFGQLEAKLTALGRRVIWFDNCSVPAMSASRPTLEELGAALGERIDASGAAQVDVVAHSMAGLIVRSYLAGKQAGNSFAPPPDPKIRKTVFLAVTNFGPGLVALLGAAAIGDPQVKELLPGSDFLFDLGTWNGGADDLRGVDAIAVAGNPGALDGVEKSSDGLVPLTSANLTFATLDPGRTRVVPYCHTDIAALAILTASCRNPPYIANVNSDDHLSWRIIRSFLNDDEQWKTIGGSAADDPVLTKYTGVMLAPRDKADQPILTPSASLSGASLEKNDAKYYAEFATAGPQTYSVGPLTGTVNLTAGKYEIVIAKPGPKIAAAVPAAGRVAGRSFAPGMFVSFYGTGFSPSAQQASSIPLPVQLAGVSVLYRGQALALQYAGPNQVNAVLPEDSSGVGEIELRSEEGAASLSIFIEGPAPAVFTQDSSGSGAAAVLQALSGILITPASPARTGDILSLYVTGLGATKPVDGLNRAIAIPSVFVGGQTAEVSYAGRAPGFAGLDQINFTVPTNTPTGSAVDLIVTSNGRMSNGSTIAIQ